jgi:hypothetical protein
LSCYIPHASFAESQQNKDKNVITGKRSDEVMEHIESLRLFELAWTFVVTDQPEWEHIRECSDCGKTFMILKAAILEQSKFSLLLMART